MIVRICKRDMQYQFMVARRHARRGDEICGLLVQYGGILRMVSVRNSSRGFASFEMAPHWQQIALSKSPYVDGKILGAYHSHPYSKPNPSRGDIAGSRNGALMLIIACHHRKFALWQVRRHRFAQIDICPSNAS